MYKLSRPLPGFDKGTYFKFVDKEVYYWITPQNRWEHVPDRLTAMLHEAMSEKWFNVADDQLVQEIVILEF